MNKFNIPEFRFPRADLPYSLALQPGSSSRSDYVQEGLIFELDCDDVEDGATSFTSKEGLEYEPITFDMFYNSDMQRIDHVSKGERGIITYASSSYKSLPLYGDLNNKTLEVSFLYDGVNAPEAGFVMYNEDRQGMGWSPSFAEGMGYVLNFREGVNTLTLTLSNMEDFSVYLNGRELSLPMMSRMARSASEPQKPTIDGETTIAVLDSELFNIRVYNKALSSAEIRNNHQYDKMMYKPIPPVPENALVDVDGNYIIDAEGNFIIDNN